MKNFCGELFECVGYIRCKRFMIGENAMKDSELIQKCIAGIEAVSIIVERYYADIYRFVYIYGSNRE